MARGTPSNVNPSLLIWARKAVGLTTKALGKKLRLDPKKIKAWEAGEDTPSIPQAKKLANALKRSLSVFYLTEAPSDTSVLPDFRKSASAGSFEASPELRMLIRTIRFRQGWASDLRRRRGAEAVSFAGQYTASSKVGDVAEAIVQAINPSKSRPSRSPSGAVLRWWSRRIEESGVLVSLSKAIDPEEANGLAFFDEWAPFIWVNAGDYEMRQVFSLIHEVAHICIGSSGISNPFEEVSSSNTVEVFCNSVAAEVLLPEREFRQAWSQSNTLNDEVTRVARHFGVSSEVALRRAYGLGFARRREFFDALAVIRKKVADAMEREKSVRQGDEGAPVYYPMTLRDRSRGLVSEVVNALHEGNLSPIEAFRILRVKIDNLGKFEEMLGAGGVSNG